ncbi:sigma factor-like helix-turn-helix DNA-binding protein [Rhodococcus sp. NPDC003348]
MVHSARQVDYGALDRGAGRVRSRAAEGDLGALRELDAATRSFATRLCRAELGAGLGMRVADRIAAESVPVAIAAMLADPGASPLRVAYTETVLGIESARPTAGLAVLPDRLQGLTRHERDVLVLRIPVGLTVEQTAEALACTVHRIRLDQHAALGALRRLVPSDSSIHS